MSINRSPPRVRVQGVLSYFGELEVWQARRNKLNGVKYAFVPDGYVEDNPDVESSSKEGVVGGAGFNQLFRREWCEYGLEGGRRFLILQQHP